MADSTIYNPPRRRNVVVRTQGLRVRRAVGELALHGLIVFAVIAATVLGYNHAASFRIAANDDLRSVFFNMYDAEQNEQAAYRWTDGNGQICLEQFGRPALGVINVTLLGDGATALGLDRAALLANDTPLATVPLAPQPRSYHLLFNGQNGSDTLCTRIVSDTAQVPSDPRTLGVPFNSLLLTRLVDSGPVMPATLQLLLNLGLALLLFSLLRRVGLPSWIVGPAIAIGSLAIGAVVSSGRIEGGIGLARAMVPLVGVLALLLAGDTATRLARKQIAIVDHQPRIVRDLLLMAFWSVVLVGGVWLIQEAQTRHGVFPLKAGVWPGWTPLVAIPILVWAGWFALVLWRLRDDRISLPLTLLIVFVGAVVLPVVLKVAVRGWDLLYITFRDNPTDYIHDVPRVGNPLTFLGEYVAISPTLAWHSANHPPGAVLLLWAIARTLGSGPVVATWAVIAIGSLSALVACWIGWKLGGPKLALLAGALFVVMPGHQVYNVTSMDTIFNLAIGAAGVAVFLMWESDATPWIAIGAGALAALGLFFTYAATQLVWFGAAIALLALLRGRGSGFVLRQGAIALATFAAIYGLVYLVSGFNIVEGALQATENNSRFVQRDAVANQAQFLAPPTLTYYVYYLTINILPFGWYLAPWGLAALTPLVQRGYRSLPRPTSVHTLALGLLAWVLGMWLSGLFIREVERIWAFTYPIAAALIAWYVWQGETKRERLWRAGLWIALFWAQSVWMRSMLNTYW